MAVTNVQEDQQNDPQTDTLIDVYNITFTIPGQNGTFTVTVPQAGDAVGAAKAAIDAKTAEVTGIYGL